MKWARDERKARASEAREDRTFGPRVGSAMRTSDPESLVTYGVSDIERFNTAGRQDYTSARQADRSAGGECKGRDGVAWVVEGVLTARTIVTMHRGYIFIATDWWCFTRADACESTRPCGGRL